jgi:hypothetical protein
MVPTGRHRMLAASFSSSSFQSIILYCTCNKRALNIAVEERRQQISAGFWGLARVAYRP